LGDVQVTAGWPSTVQVVAVTVPVVVKATLAAVLVVFVGRGAIVTVGGGPRTDQVAESLPVPPGPVALTTTVWAPRARPAKAAGDVHATGVAPSRAQAVASTVPTVVNAIEAPVAWLLDGFGAIATVGAGGRVTAVTAQLAVALAVPPGPVTATTNACVPTARPAYVAGEVHAVGVTPSRAHVVEVTLPPVVKATEAAVAVVCAGG
jgi:hypothetical protein